MTSDDINRRRFLTLLGGAAAVGSTGALSGCGSPPPVAGAAPVAAAAPIAAADQVAAAPVAAAAAGPRKVKLGFIALTDCAPLIVAKEKGFFAERGLEVELVKQASWPVTRDNLLTNQIDGAHALFSMPLSVASGIGGNGSRDLKIAMVLNNNGQAITLKKDLASAGYADLAAAKAVIESGPRTMAMTFPGGTHDTWLRYWLKATGANLAGVNIIPIPPPQMVANMKVGTMDGFCVGEPWNAVAVAQDVGYTAIATQDIWTHHPEKALVVTAKFRTEQEQNLKDTMAAVLKAQRWLDDLNNRVEAASIIAPAGYVNAPAAEILARLLGKYNLGGGLPEKDFGGEQMVFFRDGQTPLARKSYVYWWLAQYQRFGLTSGTPDYEGIANDLLLTDLYRGVAAAEGIAVPDDDMAPFTVKLDNVTFDPARVAEEVARP